MSSACGIEVATNKTPNTEFLHCGECLAINPIQYRSISAFNYEFPLPELIAEIKFNKQLYQLDLLASLFSEFCEKKYEKDQLPQLLIPIPLHPNREFIRGFNQSELLGQRVSQKLGIAIETRGIRRVKNTKSQMELSISERKTNMKDAFDFITKKSPLKDYRQFQIKFYNSPHKHLVHSGSTY